MWTNNNIETSHFNQEEMEIIKDKIGADKVEYRDSKWHAVFEGIAQDSVAAKKESVEAAVKAYADSLEKTYLGMTVSRTIYPYFEAVPTSDTKCNLCVTCRW